MLFQLPQGWVTQLFDNYGDTLSGGSITSYVAGTTTLKPTYTDASGATPNTNPTTLDSAGRANIWLANDQLYKFVVEDSTGAIVETIDNIGSVASSSSLLNYIDISFDIHGNGILSNERLFTYDFRRSVTFQPNYAGSGGVCFASPTATFAVNLLKNASSFSTGTAAGGFVISTTGAFTFVSPGGAAVTFNAGDTLTAYAPTTTDATAGDIVVTFTGTKN